MANDGERRPVVVEAWPEEVLCSQREAVAAAVGGVVNSVLVSADSSSSCLGTYTAKRCEYPRHLCFQVVGICENLGVEIRVRCAGDKCSRAPATNQRWS